MNTNDLQSHDICWFHVRSCFPCLRPDAGWKSGACFLSLETPHAGRCGYRSRSSFRWHDQNDTC